jgi:hypothetical protein
VWETRGRIGLVEGDSTIGAILDAAGNARPLASPIAARLVNDVRAAATETGSWAVMFAEAEPVQPPATPRVVAYWFGITDGARWSSIHRIAISDGAPRRKAVVTTSIGAEGIDLRPGVDLEIVDEPMAFAETCARLLADSEAREQLGASGRTRVQQLYNWGEAVDAADRALIAVAAA